MQPNSVLYASLSQAGTLPCGLTLLALIRKLISQGLIMDLVQNTLPTQVPDHGYLLYPLTINHHLTKN